uniref:AIG1-type G domain-containing protein n=1 Tax=Astyanax mexicanus TaxID=7994 RepID=A0A8B9HDA5_ASTMX
MKRTNIIIFGEEYTGKKLAVNTLLGRLIFPEDRTQAPLTLQSGDVEDRYVTVVYSPGWDPLGPPDVPIRRGTLRRAHGRVSHSTGQGPHALLLTVPIYLDREYNERMAKRLLNLFDENVWRHTILLFTRADLLDLTGLDGYLNSWGLPLQALVERCERRYHAFNNRNRNNRKQVKELLEKIDQLVAESDGKTFQLVDTNREQKEMEGHRMEVPMRNEPFDQWKEMEEQRFNSQPEEPMIRSSRQAEEDPELLLEKNDSRHYVEYCHMQDMENETTATGFRVKGTAETNEDLDSEPSQENQLEDQLVDQLEDQFVDQLEDQLEDQLVDQLEDQLVDQLEDQLVNQVSSRIHDSDNEEKHWLNGSNSNDEETPEEPSETTEQPDLQEFIKSTDPEDEDDNPEKATEMFYTELTETPLEKPVQWGKNTNRLQPFPSLKSTLKNWGLQLAEDGMTRLNISYVAYIHQQGAVRIDIFQLFFCWGNPKKSNQTLWISFFICCISIDWVLFNSQFQGALSPLPWIHDGGIHQHSEKSDEGITQDNKKSDGGIPQRKKRNAGWILKYSKRNNGGIPQRKKRNDGGIAQHHKRKDGWMPQHNKRNDGEIPQHKKINDGGIPQRKKRNDGGIAQHHKRKDGWMPQHNKRNDGEIPQHKKINDGGIPQRKKRNDGGIAQHHKRKDGWMPQHNKRNDGEIPQHKKINDGGKPQHNERNDGGIPRHNKKSDDKGVPQHNKNNNGGILQQSMKKDDEGIPQHHKKGSDRGRPQLKKKHENEGTSKHEKKSNDKETLKHRSLSSDERVNHLKMKSDDEGMTQNCRKNDGEFSEQNQKKDDEGILQQSSMKDDKGTSQCNRCCMKKSDGGIPNEGSQENKKRNTEERMSEDISEEMTVKNKKNSQDKEEKTPRDAEEIRRSSRHNVNQGPNQGRRETDVRKGGGFRKTRSRSCSQERFFVFNVSRVLLLFYCKSSSLCFQ